MQMFLIWNGYLVVGIAWSMNIIAWGKLHVNRNTVPVRADKETFY